MTTPIGTLPTAADLAKLEQSWIPKELVEQALIRRVDTASGASLVGRKDGDNCAGLVFPYRWPGEDHIREYRLRRDAPEIRYEGTTRKEVGKYLSPPGRGNMLYFPPGTKEDWLNDLDLPIVITEGEKKTLALSRLAFYELSASVDCGRFLPVGLPGVWNWRGTTGKENGLNGERLTVKGVISDFHRVKWTGRRVYILFDANVKTNEGVRAARTKLAQTLIDEFAAEVFIVDLPNRDGINGVDDYLAAVGPEKVLKLIERAKPVKARAKNESQSAEIEHLCNDAQFFHTPDQCGYASFSVGDHREVWPIKSQEFRSHLVRHFFREAGKPPSSQALQDALAVFEAKAQFDGPTANVGIRLAKYEGAIYLDLGDEHWQVVEITASGWRVSRDVLVRFRRARGMGGLPVPIKGGSLEELRPFINCGDEETWTLIVAWLAGALMVDGPFPILILHGEQGSAKSTTARVLKSLIDPASAPLRSLPKEERDLMIAAKNSWILSFDNLSGAHKWISNALCRLATGGGFATRQLHSNDEEAIFDAKRPIILNGIEEVASKSDLEDRAIILTLPPISEGDRIPEADFWAQFEMAKPRILGALLDAVSHGLLKATETKLKRYPRMADFAKWVEACSPALGFAEDQFLNAYFDNRKQAVAQSLESSAVATAILKLLQGRAEWEGSATELLVDLNEIADEDLLRSGSWPKNPRSLSDRISQLSPLLRAIGINFCRRKEGKQRTRLMAFTWER